MTSKIKKAIASLMAVASLSTCAMGISSSAADVTTPEVPEIIERYQGPETDIPFGNGAHAYAYADSRQVNLKTTASSTTTVIVQLDTVYYTTFNGGISVNYASTGTVSHNYSGTGITYAHGTHTAGSSSVGTNRYVG